MARLVKFFAGFVAVILVLLLAVGAWFRFFFDPNDLRQTIASQVEQQTGRTLSIDGDLELTYFPWVGMNIGRTRLSEDPAFGEGDFVSFDSASARVKVLPLLSKRVEIGKVALSGLNVNLIRNQQGVDNFASLLSRSEAAPADVPEGNGSTSMATGQIGGLEVLGAMFTMDDRQTGQLVKLANVNATTGPIGLDDSEIAIDASFDATVNEPALSARVELSGDGRRDGETFRFVNPRLTVSGQRQELSPDFNVDAFALTITAPAMSATEKVINMPAPDISLTAQGGSLDELDLTFKAESLEMLLAGDKLSLPKPVMNVKVSGDIVPAPIDASLTAAALTVAPTAETMTLNSYELDAMGVKARGSLDASNWSGDLAASGPLNVDEFSLRKLMSRLDIPLETADSDAMSRVSMQGKVFMRGNVARLDDMVMKLDDTTITGRAGMSDVARQVMDFTLDVDAINADGYLAPTAAPVEGDQGSAADAVVLDPATLQALNANGAMNIGKFTFSGIESTDVQIGLKANGGNIRVFPSKAKLYGGTYTGDIRIDASGARPTLSLNETVSGIDFNAFAATVMPDVPVHGTLSGNVLMNGSGATTSAIKSTLNGTTSFDFTNGYVDSIDLWHGVQSILALADKEAPPAGKTPRRTDFEQLKGSARVVDGVVTIENMIAAVEHLDVTGGGSVDLNESVVDVKVQAKIVEEEGKELLPRERNLLGFKVPVYVGGTIEAPSISPTKSVASVVGQLAKRKLASKLGLLNDEEGDGTTQGDVDTAVEDKKEELKDKIDEKAKDLLKDLFKK
ncbi:MAG: AsmA family protein [Gammaproteobacteria bacterium]